MTDPPLAYIVIDGRDGCVLCTGATLREAVSGLEPPDRGFGWRVEAIDAGRRQVVPREAYCEPNPPSRDEALTFIRDRAAKIAAAPNPATTFYRAMGCVRCNSDDPEEKQIIDYIRTAPWKLRADQDEDWWRRESTA